MDAANAVELATAPCIRVAFFAPMRRGIEASPALPDDIGQPRVVLSLSCLNQKLTLCCSAMRTWRIPARAVGNEDFSPEYATQGENSKAEANFLFESAVTH
jgi:hypothetical protein